MYGAEGVYLNLIHQRHSLTDIPQGEGILVINLITRTTLRTFGQEIPSFPATLQFYRLPNWDLLSAFGLGLTETSVWFVCKRTGQPLGRPVLSVGDINSDATR
jgi:hypothetical protein